MTNEHSIPFRASRGKISSFEGESYIVDHKLETPGLGFSDKVLQVLQVNAKWIKALKSRRENSNLPTETNKV
jgi:hypothetical protein